MARGQPFNGYAKRTMVNLVRGRMSPRSAADSIGFSWKTVKEHLDTDPEFREALEDAMILQTSGVEDKLLELAHDGNLGAIKFWLANRGVNWRDERDRTPTGSAPSEIALTVNLVGALREAYTQDDTRGRVLDMAESIPAAAIEKR